MSNFRIEIEYNVYKDRKLEKRLNREVYLLKSIKLGMFVVDTFVLNFVLKNKKVKEFFF